MATDHHFWVCICQQSCSRYAISPQNQPNFTTPIGRKRWIRTNNKYRDYFKIIFIMLIIYPFTAHIIFRGKYDRIEFKSHPSDHITSLIFGVTNKFSEHSFWSIVLWNYFVVGIPVMIGCHWSYLHRGPFKSIALNVSYIKKWGLAQWLIIAFILTFIVCSISYTFYVYYIIGKIWYYIGYLALIVLYMTVNHL